MTYPMGMDSIPIFTLGAPNAWAPIISRDYLNLEDS